MKTLMVFNPQAAAGRARRLAAPVRNALSAISTVDMIECRGPGEATRQLAAADLRDYRAIVAAGGDGTLLQVVNGLMARDAVERPPLGVVPIGTGNAFARDLGLSPGDWRGGVGLIARGRSRRVDVGRVEWSGDAFHFLNIIGAGLPVDAMRAAERLKPLGSAAYSVAALWRGIVLKSYPLVIEIDEKIIEEDALLVEVSNTRYTGTSFLMAPAARFDDGLFDVTLVRRLARARLLRLFPTIYTGRHVGFDEVTTLRAERVRIVAPAGLPLAADGEFRGEAPAVVRCLPGELELFVS